jgi:glutamate-1-semialdehyde 2,1-aminomutase
MRKTDVSEKLFLRAQHRFPGGVNSPVRAFKSVGGVPLFIKKAHGPYLWDADDQKYIDYVGAWGPAILGHADKDVLSDTTRVMQDGLAFGTCHAMEWELAEEINKIMPAIEVMRFVVSGTEACMAAIRLARAFTKRMGIIKFSGCYHGHADMLLAQAGSGVATFGLPDSPGVPEEATKHTHIAPFNDIEAVRQIFKVKGPQIAAIILEPIIGNAGFIRPSAGYLQELRSLCTNHGALLIFDEVMTGFRVALGGVQALAGIKPDIVTLGKVIGGGMPIGAYGGRRDIMQMVAPEGAMYQAGTMASAPPAIACGLSTLKKLQGLDFKALSKNTGLLVSGMVEVANHYGIPFSGDHEGGMFGFFFRDALPRSYEEAKTSDIDRFKKFFHGMLNEGIYLAPSAFEAGFLSFAHTSSDIDFTLQACKRVMATLK